MNFLHYTLFTYTYSYVINPKLLGSLSSEKGDRQARLIFPNVKR